jgi:hypothetical protein
MPDISNQDDVIDSRDVIERLEHLAHLHQAGPVDMGDDNDTDQDDLFAEERALTKLAEEASQYADDWEFGEILIRDSYFKDYARELVEECGYFNAPRQSMSTYSEPNTIDWSAWPYRCIDWDQVAKELLQDYTAVDFDGVTYWIR